MYDVFQYASINLLQKKNKNKGHCPYQTGQKAAVWPRGAAGGCRARAAWRGWKGAGALRLLVGWLQAPRLDRFVANMLIIL